MKQELKILEQTCDACPSQWDGQLADGTPVYIRYRWGFLTVELNPDEENQRTIFRKRIGDEFDGYLETEDMLKAVADVMWMGKLT